MTVNGPYSPTPNIILKGVNATSRTNMILQSENIRPIHVERHIGQVNSSPNPSLILCAKLRHFSNMPNGPLANIIIFVIPYANNVYAIIVIIVQLLLPSCFSSLCFPQSFYPYQFHRLPFLPQPYLLLPYPSSWVYSPSFSSL